MSDVLPQGVPLGMRVEELKERIGDLNGVLGVHELHVWQLTNTKMIASVHIVCERNAYADIAPGIKKLFHDFGLHSSTIQVCVCVCVLLRMHVSSYILYPRNRIMLHAHSS